MSDDSTLDQLGVGETAEASDTFVISVWNQIDNEFVGTDLDVENMRVEGASIGGTEGNERIAVEVAADVTKIDPEEKPVFQSEKRYNNLKRTTDEIADWKGMVGKWAPFGVTACVLGISLVVAKQVLNKADMTINGEPLAAPGFLELAPLLFMLLFVIWSIQYLPRMMGGRV